MTDTQTLPDAAGEAAFFLRFGTRPDGGEYVHTKDGTPEWVTEMIRKAHGGDMLPDDYVYSTVREALDWIIDGGTEDNAEEFADMTDVYNSDLMAWLGSHAGRTSYVDEAVEEFGWPKDGIMQAVMMGQYMERREILGHVLDYLDCRVSA